MNTVEDVFARYESVRHRTPAAKAGNPPTLIGSLLDITTEADAFVFDAFGVLNVGDTPIEGAAQRLDELRGLGKAIRILTNAASYGRAGAVAKFAALGINVEPHEIITSRDAALTAPRSGVIGCIATLEDDLSDVSTPFFRLAEDPAHYASVDAFLFLSSQNWNKDRHNLLEQTLKKKPRPVFVANADLVAPRDDGLSIEPGYYGHLIADTLEGPVEFFGKPFPEVFEMAEASLPGIEPERILMCGDTLHTDILGAAHHGWLTVLVTQDGLFAGHDLAPFIEKSGITPNWQVLRI